jgi:hypothetical protein
MHHQPPFFNGQNKPNTLHSIGRVTDQPHLCGCLASQPHFLTASKTGRCSSTLSPSFCFNLRTTPLQAAMAFSRQRIRLAGPADLEIRIRQRSPTQSLDNAHFPEQKPHAAFSNIMAELPREEFDENIDWSKVDLLDACSNPAIGGMGLGR